jgi:hypothetical protein
MNGAPETVGVPGEPVVRPPHDVGVEWFCDERDRMVAAADDPRIKPGIAATASLPSGPDDELMPLLYEFDMRLAAQSHHKIDVAKEIGVDGLGFLVADVDSDSDFGQATGPTVC